MSINRAFEQMMRGMGPDSTPESRKQVNAETMQARIDRQAELESRPVPVLVGKYVVISEREKWDSGHYGRLD